MEKLDQLLQQEVFEPLNNAIRELSKIQKKEIQPIVTSYDFLNKLNFGGLQKNTIISFLARPSGGKSHLAQVLRKDIMESNTNSCLLYFNWEMSWFNLLILEIKKAINKPLNYILNNKPTEEELEEYKKVTQGLRNKRFTSVDMALTPEEFKYVCEKYIEINSDKDHIVIVIDHIGITKGVNKMEAIYSMMEISNFLKLKYANKLTFVVLGQLNREIEKLWRTRDTNPINLRVTSEYIFSADAIMQGSDLVIGMVIPQRAGLDKYCTINIEKNPHLEEHVIDEDKDSPKEYKRLKGDNRIYYDVIKKRMDDGEPRLYCQILDPEQEEFNIAVANHEKDLTTMDEELIF